MEDMDRRKDDKDNDEQNKDRNIEEGSGERCGKCRRLKIGHPKPYGRENCRLEVIEDH